MPPLHGSFKVSELVDVYSYIFLLFFFKIFCFYPSTLDCLIIEICDSIYSAFKHGCSSITTRSKILHLNLSGLISSFFYTFFLILIFLDFHFATFYLLKVEFLPFPFILYGVIIFSFDLFGIGLQTSFPAFFFFYEIISILCSWLQNLRVNLV